MKITAYDQDVTPGVLVLIETVRWVEFLDLDEEETASLLALCDLLQAAEEAQRLGARIRGDIARREDAQRRRDEFARTEAQRTAERQKAAAHLAAEMREREPALVRAGWTDGELVELHRMRNAGIA